MKIIVLAQVPPPMHGQSAMVAALVEARGDWIREYGSPELVHVNLGLSRDSQDVGRFRPAKFFALIGACFRAIRLRFGHGRVLLYYIPAPGRRVPLYRDWIAMSLCRPWFSGLILHWHATGLSDWLKHRGSAVERAITRLLLGRPTLSIALSDRLKDDAEYFGSRKIAIVPNGISDPAGSTVGEGREAPPGRVAPPGSEVARRVPAALPYRVLFLGLGCEEKGLFDTAGAIAELEALEPGRFRLTFAGGFQGKEDESRFRHILKPGVIEYAGFADAERKRSLLEAADVFCLPSYYPHEGQPLALIEALAYDLPVVTTRWRGIPEMVPEATTRFVEPKSSRQIAEALRALRDNLPPPGLARKHFLDHFTRKKWDAAMRVALASVTSE